MPLDEKAKEEIRALFKADPLKGISLTELKTGVVQICAICTSIWDKTLKKYLKKGWIPTKIYDANEELICKWEIAEENVEYYTQEVDSQKDTIADFSNMLQKIETDPFYARAYAARKYWYVEHLQIAKDELVKAEGSLEESTKEIPALKKQIAKLRNFDYLRENKYI
jgi:predicted  nucleic acid-binding Zn-ribbon protein